MRRDRASVTVSRMLSVLSPADFESSFGLSWRHLHPGEVQLAYPVILATGGVPGLAEWIALTSGWEAGRAGRDSRGVVALQGRDGVFVAVFLYRIEPGAQGDLLLPLLRAAEIVRSERTVSAALEAAVDLARRSGCARVLMEVDSLSAPGRALEARLVALAPALRLRREGARWVMASAS